MSTPAPHPWKYLEPRPGSFYRQLFVKGKRIRARVLYGWTLCEDPKLTPEEVAAEFDVPVEAVREAIAYCESNPPELEQDYRREEALTEAMGMNDLGYLFHPTPKRPTLQELARIRNP